MLKSVLILTFFVIFPMGIFAADSTPQGEQRLARLPTPATDQATEALIRRVFLKSPAMSQVQVKVDSGVISLAGELPTKNEAQWMLEAVNRLPDVVAVVDNTTVRIPSIRGLSPLWNEVHRLTERFEQLLPTLLFVIAFFILSYFLSNLFKKGVGHLWSRKIRNPFVLGLVTRLSLVPIWMVFFYLGLRILGLSTFGATLIGGTSLIGLILGLAFKGIAENYLAGLLLASRSPFTRGDLIQIGDHIGYVENLNMRGTTIIDLDGNLILIPNSTVIQSVVENQTANPKTRTSFRVGIGYQDSIPRAQDLIVKAVSEVRGVLEDPAPSVIVEELGATRIELRVLIWFNVKENREPRVKSRAMIQTKETLLANGFNIPTEVRELVFGSSLRVEHTQMHTSERVSAEDRKTMIREQAALNLADPESVEATQDPSPEDLLELAKKHPLPTNASETDLLKQRFRPPLSSQDKGES